MAAGAGGYVVLCQCFVATVVTVVVIVSSGSIVTVWTRAVIRHLVAVVLTVRSHFRSSDSPQRELE